jgi:AraC-like DNA-binding protein
VLSSSADAMHSESGWSSPHLPGVEVSLHSHFGPLPPFRLIPMVQLKVLVAGEAELRWGSDVWRETTGGCMAIAPECSFRVVQRLTDKASTLRVCVAPHVFDEWMRRHGGPRSSDFHVRHLPDPALAEALRDLERTMRAGAGAAALRASFEGVMRRAWHFLGATCETGNGSRPEVRKVVQILQDRFADSISLDQLTASVGLSKFHLIRLFRDEVGVAPHAFQLQLRVSRARELLASGLSVADVADACGFADQAHFSRCFKSTVGYTPGAFRRLE